MFSTTSALWHLLELAGTGQPQPNTAAIVHKYTCHFTLVSLVHLCCLCRDGVAVFSTVHWTCVAMVAHQRHALKYVRFHPQATRLLSGKNRTHADTNINPGIRCVDKLYCALNNVRRLAFSTIKWRQQPEGNAPGLQPYLQLHWGDKSQRLPSLLKNESDHILLSKH